MTRKFVDRFLFIVLLQGVVTQGQVVPEAFVEFTGCTFFAAIFGRDNSICDLCCQMNSSPAFPYNPASPGFATTTASGAWKCHCAANNECTTKHRNPEQCVETPGCNYCLEGSFEGNRCNFRDRLLRGGCKTGSIIDKIEKKTEVTPGELPTTPITLPLFPGTKTSLSITFKLAKHPLDLYYLMDFSGSMFDDKQNVVRLAEELVSTVKVLSSDSTLGFGTFVDKPVSPFGWKGTGDYSFRNHLQLTSSTMDLATLVEQIQIRNGGDNPESQGDAIFQVATCTEEIGWRPFARHLLLVATDAPYHKNGDGLRGGITTSFDETAGCLLNSEGYYKEQLTLDYPSDDQLVKKMTDNKITPIFAVPEYTSGPYRDLSIKLLTASVGILSSDSSNVVNLIRDEYNKIANRFEMEQSRVTDEIQIKYFSNCNGDAMVETTVCNALNREGTVTFRVEFDVSKCPNDEKEWEQIVRLNPLGLPTHVDIALALICSKR